MRDFTACNTAGYQIVGNSERSLGWLVPLCFPDKQRLSLSSRALHIRKKLFYCVISVEN